MELRFSAYLTSKFIEDIKSDGGIHVVHSNLAGKVITVEMGKIYWFMKIAIIMFWLLSAVSTETPYSSQRALV